MSEEKQREIEKLNEEFNNIKKEVAGLREDISKILEVVTNKN